MQSLDDIKFWYNFNSHVRKRYLRAILSLPKEEALKDRGASHPSILDIFVHVLDGYRYFFLGVIDPRPETEYEPWTGKVPLEELKEKERLVDTMIMRKIDSLTENDLGKLTIGDFSLRDVLNHMVEEELQHRGEINALFWQMDIDPPISDIEDAKYVKKHVNGERCELCDT